MGMTDDEIRQFKELGESVKSLKDALTEEKRARELAETKAETAEAVSAKLARDANRKSLSEFVAANRLAFQSSPEEAVDKLEKLQSKLDTEDFEDYLDEKRKTHAQLSESHLFSQKGREAGTPLSVEEQINGAVTKFLADNPTKSKAEAVDAVLKASPHLYTEYRHQAFLRAKRGE